MNHQNFLNRHARHRPRFVTSVRAPLPVAAFRKTPLESKASFSLSIAWNYGLRILVSKRISQPTSLLLLLLVWDYLTESREEELRLVARNPLLAEAGGGRRKAAGPPGFFRKWTSPSSIRYLRISLIGRIPDLRGNYKYYITFDKNTMRL